SVEADGKKVRIAFSGTDSGLIGRDVHQFTGDYASLVGKNIKIVRKGKKKRITPIASENGERKVIKAMVELRGKNGELIKRLKTVWDKTYADPVRDFRMAETKLTAEERKTWKQRRAKLAEERKRKAEEKKKREAARREQMKKNGEEPPPSLPKKPKPPATPPKAVEPQSKGTVKTTFYMLNSKKLLGFAASGEKSRMSWISAVIDGDAVVLSRRGNDPITRVRYGCADNPKCSLWGKNGLPVFPFDKKVSRK
ncbi:MAG: hypothetical protein KAG97_00695, partial [Victivallales bacterium]|nr:hypothetical protein [Victivallales bacterium]